MGIYGIDYWLEKRPESGEPKQVRWRLGINELRPDPRDSVGGADGGVFESYQSHERSISVDELED